jgi:hypothetical protein
MLPLVDADILLYEAGYAAEAAWAKEGVSPPFDYAAEILDSRVSHICHTVQATFPPILYLTGKTNFRDNIAKKQPYKERPGKKPFHYHNLKAYVKHKYIWESKDGLEADDLMAIEQTVLGERTIICTRDKDLRAVPGWHYGWEMGNQPSYGPKAVSELGAIRLSNDRKSIKGEGLLFFYGQCIVGDSVDTIPGLPGSGAVQAFNLLKGCPTSQEAFKRVLEAYRGLYGDDAETELLEQGRLLWMTRELHEDDSPVLWELPIGEN